MISIFSWVMQKIIIFSRKDTSITLFSDHINASSRHICLSYDFVLAFLPFIWKKLSFSILERNIGQGWNTYLSPRAEIDISQNMALIYYDSIVGPYFCFSSLSISYAKLSFHPHEGIYPHLIAMYKTENKDFAFYFSEKGPINIS